MQFKHSAKTGWRSKVKEILEGTLFDETRSRAFT